MSAETTTGSSAMDPEYNLQELLTTDIRIQIPEDVVTKATAVSPWQTVPGAFNVRDISATSTLRPGFIYRSGVLRWITEEGKAVLRDSLGIRTIYDLRKPTERESLPSPVIDGVETVWLGYGSEPAPVDLKLFADGDDGARGYARMYLDLLNVLQPTYRRVFEHIRDSPEKPFLFHCMGGKDRTGVLAALILRLAGSSYEAITNDYCLTRIGLEPARDILTQSMKLNTLDSDAAVTPENAGLLILCSIKASGMMGFLQALEEAFEGGVRGYLTTQLRFSEEDVQTICANLKGD